MEAAIVFYLSWATSAFLAAAGLGVFACDPAGPFGPRRTHRLYIVIQTVVGVCWAAYIVAADLDDLQPVPKETWITDAACWLLAMIAYPLLLIPVLHARSVRGMRPTSE